MLLNVAWLAIGLGITVELLPLLVAALLSAAPGVRGIVADLAENVTWAFLVCLGLAFGQVARQTAQPVATTAAGLLAEPVAFISARSIHKGALSALSVIDHTNGPNPWMIGGIKAIEYAVLGYLVARLLKAESARWSQFVERGLAVGIVFTPLLLLVVASTTQPALSSAALTTRGLNEFIFPIGCALILFVGESWAKHTGH
jgi:hypothetical protein